LHVGRRRRVQQRGASTPSERAGRTEETAPSESDDPKADDGKGGAPEEGEMTVTERGNDATSSGDVDGYPELTQAKLEGSSEGVLLDLGFAKKVPDPTPKATQMTLALSIIDAEGGRYLLNGLGTDRGWDVTVVTSEGQMNFGGLFDIRGKNVQIGIPWADLGGPKPFNWIVSSAWTGDQSEGMSYAFDSIPNEGFKGFPDKG
jgi:hypothetical protein